MKWSSFLINFLTIGSSLPVNLLMVEFRILIHYYYGKKTIIVLTIEIRKKKMRSCFKNCKEYSVDWNPLLKIFCRLKSEAPYWRYSVDWNSKCPTGNLYRKHWIVGTNLGSILYKTYFIYSLLQYSICSALKRIFLWRYERHQKKICRQDWCQCSRTVYRTYGLLVRLGETLELGRTRTRTWTSLQDMMFCTTRNHECYYLLSIIVTMSVSMLILTHCN